MQLSLKIAGAAAALAAMAAAQDVKPASPQQAEKAKPVVKDDFKREGKPAQRAKKDPLEGKAPPPLRLAGWMNTKGKAIKLGDLKGKVVVLKFWGVW